MNVCCVAWIFIVKIFVTRAKLYISMSEVDISDLPENETVKLIEGDRLLLRCSSDNENMSVSWHRHGVSTVNNTVEIEQIRLKDAGIYLCRATNENVTKTKKIYIDVLYPPSYPFIEGETIGIYGEQITLKCVSDGNPVPNYQWRRANQNGRVLSLNQTLQIKIDVDISGIVCIAESLLISTLGKSKNAKSPRGTAIRGIESAVIESVYNFNGNNLNVQEGDDVDIRCVTSGKPSPKVWWTKVGSDSFFFEGDRLVEYKTGKHFEGNYTCHAQNSVFSVDKKKTVTGEAEKTVNIRVIQILASDVNYPSKNCLAYCEKQCDVTIDQHNMTPNNNKNNSTEKIRPGISYKTFLLIIANGIGWTALVVCIIIHFVFYVKRKRGVKEQKQKQSPIQTDNSGYLCAQSLSGSYVSEVRLPDSTYMELYASIGDQRYDDSSERESNVTVASDNTYLKPIHGTIINS